MFPAFSRLAKRLSTVSFAGIRFRLTFHGCHKRPEKSSESGFEELSNTHGFTDKSETERRFWRLMLASESCFISKNRMKFRYPAANSLRRLDKDNHSTLRRRIFALPRSILWNSPPNCAQFSWLSESIESSEIGPPEAKLSSPKAARRKVSPQLEPSDGARYSPF